MCPFNRDRALNRSFIHVAPTAATTSSKPSSPPTLEDFLTAAGRGRLLWARPGAEGRSQLCSGTTPDADATDQIGRLFVGALRAHVGEAASAIAEREWRLAVKPRRLLPARTVRCAVACAEAALSLLMAQSHLLQFEFSARMGGWRFRRVVESLGLEPAALGIGQRLALDEALADEFRRYPTDAEAVAARLRLLLIKGLH